MDSEGRAADFAETVHLLDSTYVQKHVYACQIPVYYRNYAGDATAAVNSLAPRQSRAALPQILNFAVTRPRLKCPGLSALIRGSLLSLFSLSFSLFLCNLSE